MDDKIFYLKRWRGNIGEVYGVCGWERFSKRKLVRMFRFVDAVQAVELYAEQNKEDQSDWDVCIHREAPTSPDGFEAVCHYVAGKGWLHPMSN